MYDDSRHIIICQKCERLNTIPKVLLETQKKIDFCGNKHVSQVESNSPV